MNALSRILPDRIDNRYRGHPLALWLFVPIVLQKLAASLTHPRGSFTAVLRLAS